MRTLLPVIGSSDSGVRFNNEEVEHGGELIQHGLKYVCLRFFLGIISVLSLPLEFIAGTTSCVHSFALQDYCYGNRIFEHHWTASNNIPVT